MAETEWEDFTDNAVLRRLRAGGTPQEIADDLAKEGLDIYDFLLDFCEYARENGVQFDHLEILVTLAELPEFNWALADRDDLGCIVHLIEMVAGDDEKLIWKLIYQCCKACSFIHKRGKPREKSLYIGRPTRVVELYRAIKYADEDVDTDPDLLIRFHNQRKHPQVERGTNNAHVSLVVVVDGKPRKADLWWEAEEKRFRLHFDDQPRQPEYQRVYLAPGFDTWTLSEDVGVRDESQYEDDDEDEGEDEDEDGGGDEFDGEGE